MSRLWMRLLAVSCGLTLATSAQATHQYSMQSYLNSPVAPRGWQPAAFWCDAGQRVLALTRPEKGAALAGPVLLLEWKGIHFTRQRYRLGRSDAGAGNVFNTIAPAGVQPDSDGLFKYYIHTSNVENTQDPAYLMSRVVEFVLPGGAYACRFESRARFMGATSRHGISILEDGKGLRYVSVNRNGSVGLSLVGGKRIVDAAGDEYRWENAGYVYVLRVGRPDAHLDVLRGHQVVQSETFLAYSVSVKN